jgi:hypothetical protein
MLAMATPQPVPEGIKELDQAAGWAAYTRTD